MGKELVVDVVGPALQNSGDWMMLDYACRRLEADYSVLSSGDPAKFTRLQRVAYGVVRRTPGWLQLRRAKYLLGGMLPKVVRRVAEMPGYADIRAALDCSGFQYGDAWSYLVRKNEWRSAHYKAIRARGGRIIFLPQAFGPFLDSEVTGRVREILGSAHMIYARDSRSFEHVARLGLPGVDVRRAPDFTILVDAAPPENRAYWADRACIVPNTRMLDMADERTRAGYLDFLYACISEVKRLGLEPVVLVHERFDIPLAVSLAKQTGIQLISEPPLTAKGIIGSAALVLSSRFHACVSGLSQSVPTLGTGWTHKYVGLFEDFGCPENLLTSLPDQGTLREKLGKLVEPEGRATLVSILDDRTAALRKQATAMWEDILTDIRGAC